MNSASHRRIHILNGTTFDVKPPSYHYILNESGERDDSGRFVIPERIPDLPPQRPELNIQPLLVRFPELNGVFAQNKPRNIPTVHTQLHCLRDAVERTDNLIRARIEDYRTKQSAQTQALHAFVAHIKKQVKEYEDYLDDSKKMLQELKSSARQLPDSEEIKRTCSTVIRDISGKYDTLERYISRADVEVANNYIQRYLNDENNEMEEGVSAASKKFHLIKNRISSLEENSHYLSATDLDGDLYNYNDCLAHIQKLQSERKHLVRQFEQKVSQLERASTQPEVYKSVDMEMANRDWVRELSDNDEQLLQAVQECELKKFTFDTHIYHCVRTLLDIYSDLRQDLNDPSIPDRFKKAQQHLKYITFATNLKQVYSACMTEMDRRINEFGESFRQQIAAFNERTETLVQEENRKRNRFLEEQRKLLGGAEIPATLVPGVTEKLSVPRFDPEIDEFSMGEHVRENQDLLEFSILNDPNESNIFDANFNPNTLRPTQFNSQQGRVASLAGRAQVIQPDAQSLQIQKQQDEINALQHRVKQQDAEIHEQNQNIARLREQLTQTRSTLQEEIQSREVAEKKITEHLATVASMKEEKRNLEGNVEDLAHQLSAANDEIALLKGNLQTNTIAQKESFRAELNARMEQLSTRLLETQKQNDANLKKLQEAQEKNAALTAERDSLYKYTQTMGNELDKAQRDLAVAKDSYTAEHRKWFEEQQELKQKLQTIQMKHHDLSIKVTTTANVVFDKDEENSRLKVQLQKKQKEIEDLMQKHSNSSSSVEASLKKTIGDLKVMVQEKDHRITFLEQSLRLSAKAVDTFKESVSNQYLNGINRLREKHAKHMREVAQLKSTNTSATRDILIILKKQLEHSAQAITEVLPVLCSTQDMFPEMTTICALFSEPTSTITSVCSLLDTITNEHSGNRFLEQSVASPNIQDLGLAEEKKYAMGNFKPRDNVLFFRVKDKQGVFEAVTEEGQGDGQYFLDPDSYAAYCSLADDNKKKDDITGEVIQVLQRSPSDDPLKLRRNYKTLLVVFEE